MPVAPEPAGALRDLSQVLQFPEVLRSVGPHPTPGPDGHDLGASFQVGLITGANDLVPTTRHELTEGVGRSIKEEEEMEVGSAAPLELQPPDSGELPILSHHTLLEGPEMGLPATGVPGPLAGVGEGQEQRSVCLARIYRVDEAHEPSTRGR